MLNLNVLPETLLTHFLISNKRDIDLVEFIRRLGEVLLECVMGILKEVFVTYSKDIIAGGAQCYWLWGALVEFTFLYSAAVSREDPAII